MFKSKVFFVVLTGLTWFAVGFSLLLKGLKFLVEGAAREDANFSLILIAAAMLVGFLKGRFILAKTAKRVIAKVAALPSSFKWTEVYSLRYYILILSMISLGVSLRYLPISVQLRGFVDVAIGSALMNGALVYFRGTSAVKSN